MDFVLRDYEVIIAPDNPLNKKERSKQEITTLQMLYEGNRFEVVGLEDSFRNLYVIGMSNCSVSVKGEFRERKDLEFKVLSRGHAMSLNTRVRRI